MNNNEDRFVQDRCDAIADFLSCIRHDYNIHAPGGIWEFIPPSDYAPEITVLCRRMGVAIEENMKRSLQALAQCDSLGDLCDTDMIPGYDYAYGRTGRDRAFYESITLMRTMDLKVIADGVLKDAGPFAIPASERGILIRALQLYSKRVLSRFYKDVHDMQKQADLADEKARNGEEPKKRSILGAFFAAILPEKSDDIWPKQILPKLWPPIDMTGISQAVKTARQGSYSEGWYETLETIYEELQLYHFSCMDKKIYPSLMAHNGVTVKPAAFEKMAEKLFDEVRMALRVHLAEAVADKEGEFSGGRIDALGNLKEILSGFADSNTQPDDADAARWLTNHWLAKAGKIAGVETTQKPEPVHNKPAPSL